MKKEYICPDIKTLKSGTEDFILEYDVVGRSLGTNDGWAKDRGEVDDVPVEDDFWSTK